MRKFICICFIVYLIAPICNAQITAEIANYNCGNNTYNVEFCVSGAQPQLFNDVFWGYDAVSQGGFVVTDCYDLNLVQSPCTCTFLYLPVCACDGRTYGNECEARQCNGYEPLFQGECDGSELICFTVYDIPVNSGDIINITSNYINNSSNTYVYETIMLQIPSNNECSVLADCACPNLIDPSVICTFQYDPVCGCDGMTYSNACIAQFGNGIPSWTKGECGNTTGDVVYVSCDDGNPNTINDRYDENCNCVGDPISSCACSFLIDNTVFCPAVIDPVCGCDGVTYSNSCVAQNGNGIPSWTMGECGNTTGGIIYASCDDGDPDTSNDRYDEDCNCVGEIDESCICPDAIDNNITCTTNFDPVCGCDGVTYSNACVAQYQNGVVAWTPGPCNNTNQDTIYGFCNDFNPYTNNDHYNLNCSCSGFLSGCICEDLIDLDAPITTEFDPVCGCNGIDYGNTSAAQNAGVISWTNGPCNDCFNDPLSFIWLDDIIQSIKTDFCPIPTAKVKKAMYNSAPIIIIELVIGFDATSEYIFSCNGDMIQLCGTTIAGYDCALDAGITTNNLTTIEVLDICTQSYGQPMSITRTCDDGNSATINDQYDENCNCIGEGVCIDEIFPMIAICEANLSAYTGPNTDPNGDGIVGWQGSTNWMDGNNVVTISSGSCSYTQTIFIDIIYIGESCDDNNPDTMNDLIQADCSCQGSTDPCINITDENFGAFSICNAELAAYNGPMGDPNGDGTSGWQGSKDWKNGVNQAVITNSIGCTYTQQVILNVFNVGDSCDDGNPDTMNDIIQADCSCQGSTFNSCINITDENFGTFSICNAELGAYEGPLGDPNGDGTSGWQGDKEWVNGLNSEEITDANGCVYTQQVTLLIFNVGESCDDGNPNTENDFIDTDCQCRGQIIANCECPDLIDLTVPCPAVYDPVCGCDSITYSNACVAQYHNGIPSWTPGECDTITSNLVIRAICDDTNDFTFDDYINDSCQCVGYLNSCICPDLIDPDKICPAIYDPVCGCDGMTYSNSCVAEANGVINWTIGECKACSDDPMTYIWLQNMVDSLKDDFCPAISMEVRIANYNGNQIIIIQAVIGIDFTFDWVFDCKGQMIQNCMITIAGVVCPKPAGIDLSTITSTKIFDICTGTYTPATIQYYQCLVNGAPGYYDENCNCTLGTNLKSTDIIEFNLYPNPAKDYIVVDMEGRNLIEIINANGIKVHSTFEKRIDLLMFNSGIYFVKVNNQTKHFIIAK